MKKEILEPTEPQFQEDNSHYPDNPNFNELDKAHTSGLPPKTITRPLNPKKPFNLHNGNNNH